MQPHGAGWEPVSSSVHRVTSRVPALALCVAEHRGQETATQPGELGIPEAPTHPCQRPPHAPWRHPHLLSSSALGLFPPFGPALLLLFILEAFLILWLLFFAFPPSLPQFSFCLLPLPSSLSLTCLSSILLLALPGFFPSSFPSLLLFLCLVLSLFYLGPPPPSPLTPLTSCPPLCSCPRRPLADPPLLPRLPGWFQRALRPPGEP